jgi:bifunctional DNA-binding transcriptional regulator/antitoxin component of YhaV-PrlF toxin-antitoxin module
VTSKLQVTIPKAVAERYGIAPGAEIDWLPAGEAIRVVLRNTAQQRSADRGRRLMFFDGATERQHRRDLGADVHPQPADRGWVREELYQRGVPG